VGISSNEPLIAVVGPAAEPWADLPEIQSFLPFNAPNLVLSTMKAAEGLTHPSGAEGFVILRVYDIEGRDTETAVELIRPVRRAVRTNLIEEEGVELKPQKGRLILPVGHHAVETLKLFPDWTRK
ncbi:MAG: hypothetical protein IH583_13320, partial [Candidatus Aminicenantes bacterium]|nr:hypothetical protein [Candidatus Aminicenantes bacterium]